MNFGGFAAGGGGGAPAAGQGENQQNANVDIMSWYMKIPVVSRMYLTGAFLTTAACSVDLVSPFTLYFNWDLVYNEGQIWRLITPYLYFGVFSVDFLFHMYFLVQYSRLLEEGDFRGRTANYVLMLLFGIGNISLVAAYTKKLFLGHALTFMMTYVWGRRNEDVKMVFLGFIQFNAPYLPWVMLTFGALIGKSDGIAMDLIGITVGHLYYFLEYVYPTIAEIRSWPIKHILVPPIILHMICGTYDAFNEDNELTAAIAAIAEQERREERQRLRNA